MSNDLPQIRLNPPSRGNLYVATCATRTSLVHKQFFLDTIADRVISVKNCIKLRLGCWSYLAKFVVLWQKMAISHFRDLKKAIEMLISDQMTPS